jgi:segregation and condensation protein B
MSEEDVHGQEEAQEDSPSDLDNRLVVEGMLFSADRPLRMADIEEATNLERRAVRSALKRLASDYRRRNTALEVVKVGSRWTMQVRSEYTPAVRTVAAPEVNPRVLRTLALVAYHQPVLQSDLQEMIGPKVYEHVRELEAQGLVRATRRGATKELTTTQRFPEYFGIGSAKREDIKRFLAERVGIEPGPLPEHGEAGPTVAEETPAEVGEEEEQQPPEPVDGSPTSGSDDDRV